MTIVKNVLLIAAIGLAVAFSGCTGPGSEVSGTAQPTPVQTVSGTPVVQTSGYQLSLEVRTLADCIAYSGTTQSCSQMNLDVRNNNPQSLEVVVVKNILVLKNEKSIEMYDNTGGLSNACVHTTGLVFNLSADADRNLAMCYPLVHNSDAPTLDITVMMNGIRKDYSFDLTKYGLTD